MIRLVSWNLARRRAAWPVLSAMDADVALVQEASRPDPGWGWPLGPDPPWETSLLGKYRAVADRGPALSDAVELRHRTTTPVATAATTDLVVSRGGSIAVTDVLSNRQVKFTVASVYAAWEKVGARGYADGSAHRILSDLTPLVMDRQVRLVVARDWNCSTGTASTVICPG